MRNRRLTQSAILMAALAVACLGADTGIARADNLESFNFSGTLVFSPSGDNAVTGSFTLDTTNATVTAFDFTTPVVTIDTADGWSSTVLSLTPAYSPDEDFVQLFFSDLPYQDVMNLLFQTTLGSFSGSSFYTSIIEPDSQLTNASALSCRFFGISQCSEAPFDSGFSSGTATETPVATPEPSFWELVAADLLGLGALLQFGKRFGLRRVIDS